MTLDEIIQNFSGLSQEQQTIVLAKLAFRLTILARETYFAEEDSVFTRVTAHGVNELQHRVTAAVVSRLLGDTMRYPDDVLVRMCADPQGGPVAQSCGPMFVQFLTEIDSEK